MQPRFIVFDGVEGCGKSTQVRMLAEHLRARGHQVVVTHEPGGTPVGERIRALLLDPGHPEMSPLTELMLFCASRAQHCDQLIRPALAAGRLVICDRFASATVVYQGYAGGLGMEVAEQVNAVATGGLDPDLLFILDLDPAVGLQRKLGGHLAGADRIEGKSLDFHHRVREGFLRYAARHPESAVVIPGDGEPQAVHARVRERLGEMGVADRAG